MRAPDEGDFGGPHPAAARRISGWMVLPVYLVMAAVVLYPILVVRIPGLGDYLNHLARMYILSDSGHSTALSQLYRVQWQAIPYLSMDAAFVVLGRIAPIYDAGRIYVAICLILPLLSVMVLHFALHRRFSLVPAAAFLICQNYLLSWGFLNYLPALCLAVMVFAGWIASAGWSRWPRVALFSVLTLALYFSHLVAFGAYGLAVVSFELARAWRAGFRPWRMIAADWIAAGAQAVPAIAVAVSVTVERPWVGPLPTYFGDLNERLSALLSPVLFFGSRLDTLAFAFLVAVLVLGLLTRRLRVAPAVWPAALALGVLSSGVPTMLWGTWGMDFRLPLVVAMLLIGGTSTTERMGRGLGGAVLGVILALTIVRSVSIAGDLRIVDGQIAEVRRVVAEMPRGQRLLLVDTRLEGRGGIPMRATMHVGMVALIDRDAFVPTLFTGLSTVRPVPALRASSTPNGPPLTMDDLADGLGRKDEPGVEKDNAMGGRVYWMGWEKKFDYVLIQHFGTALPTLPANLRLVAGSYVANLYRIEKPAGP